MYIHKYNTKSALIRIIRSKYYIFLGVCLGSCFRVALECGGKSGALHTVRGSDNPSQCSVKQASCVAQTIYDQRPKPHHVHDHGTIYCAMYGELYKLIVQLYIILYCVTAGI